MPIFQSFPILTLDWKSAVLETRVYVTLQLHCMQTLTTVSTISPSPALQNRLLKCNWALIVINGLVFVALMMRMVTKVQVRWVKSLCITPCARYQP